MQTDDKRQIWRLGRGYVEVRRPPATEQSRQKHGMAKAGHREQLGHALKQADDNGFEVVEVGRHRLGRLPGGGVSVRCFAVAGYRSSASFRPRDRLLTALH